MELKDHGKLKAAFLKAFASVPTPLRDQIILAIGDQPYNWNAVFVEIKAGTTLSESMLKRLRDMEVI